jgi:alpha-D-ribose 1-methylphosphonate 5-triphosphate synthase subunit PhnH
MLTIAPPDAAEQRCNATFEALMWSMARPGEPQMLPALGLAGVVETLVDIECSVFAEDQALRTYAAETGARIVDDPADADHVFLESLDAPEALLVAIPCGSALYPDDGATVVANAPHGRGHRLRLTGPGIEGVRELALGVSPAFWNLRAQLCAYPEGFDLLLVDGPAVVGIPRSTKVEVL